MARLFVFLTAMAAAAAVSAQGIVRVVIDTEHGEIEVAIDQDHAPGTSANFLRYLDAGHYDGGQFHRTVTMENAEQRRQDRGHSSERERCEEGSGVRRHPSRAYDHHRARA